jgi:hypothetical protein
MMNMMNRIVLYTFFLAFVATTGCGKAIDRSMVVGIYYANHKKGVDSLEVKTDGTYEYHYKAPDGKEFRNTNRWEFEYSEGKPMITFLDFTFALPGYGSKKPGFWIVEVQKSFWGSKLRLCIDPDLNYYYVKQK